jgi:hypothetical protein
LADQPPLVGLAGKDFCQSLFDELVRDPAPAQLQCDAMAAVAPRRTGAREAAGEAPVVQPPPPLKVGQDGTDVRRGQGPLEEFGSKLGNGVSAARERTQGIDF